MTRTSRLGILLGAGIVAVLLALLLVSKLRQEPAAAEPRPWLDESKFQEGLEQLRAKKFRCEEEILSTIRQKRPHLEAIVRAVEKLGLKAGDEERFAFPKSGKPEDLRKVEAAFDRGELGDFCDDNTLVCAVRRKDGSLFVKIVICEMGHAGTYSVMYASKLMSTEEFEKSRSIPAAFESVEPHWWALVEWY